MKREPLLLVAVVLIVAWLSWGLVQGETGPRRIRVNDRRLDLAELPALDPVPALDLGESGAARDPMRPPREEEPLPPLELPLPEVAEPLVQLPPPVPDAGPSWWAPGLLVELPPPPGGLSELIEAPDEGGEETGTETEAFGEQEPDYGTQYDSVRLNAFTILYGHILNEDRYSLRRGATIVFQEVDPRTGAERFAPQTLEADRYESFALADTLRNRLELRARSVSDSAGSIPQRIETVDWLLQVGAQEPVAYERAESLARVGTQLAAADLETWMALGRVWEATFRLDRAFALYATLAGEPVPDLPQEEWGGRARQGAFQHRGAPRVGMARVLRRLGLDREAEGPLRAAVAADDGDPEAPLELGRLLLDLGRTEEARAAVERARALAAHLPRSSPLALRTGRVLGEVMLELGRWDEASALFQDVLRAADAGGRPDAEDAVAARGGLVSASYLSGDFDVAAAAAAAAVEEAGAAARLLLLRGLASAAIGAPAAEVVRDLRAAAAAAPLDAAPALAAEAYWLWRMGEEEDARETLDRALALDPSQPFARYLHGALARRAGDLEGAREDLRGLIQEQPRCAAAMEEFGWLLHQENRNDAAEIALRRAAEEVPGRADLQLRRGLNLLSLGRIGEARAVLAEALAADPGLHAARNALAWAAYAEDDLPGAVAEFGEVLDRLRDQEDHPQARYAAVWQERIQVHARLRRWRDAFGGQRFRPQWDVRSGARLGVEPRIAGGRLVLRGTHSGPGRTRVARTVTALAFRSFQVELVVGEAHRGSAGAFLALESARGRQTWTLEVTRDREGGVGWLLRQGSREENGRSALRLAAGVPATVRFDLDREQNPPVLTVTVDGNEIYQGQATALRSPTTQLAAGIFAETRNAVAVDVAADNVELIYLLP